MEYRVLVPLVVALVAAACTNPAELDRRDLESAFALDAPLDRALHEAESAAKKGDDPAAIDILKRTAEPAAQAAVDAANAVAPRTAWGRTEKAALVSIENDRKSEIARYESALAGTDLDAQLAAVEKQLELEKRVVAFSGEIERGP